MDERGFLKVVQTLCKRPAVYTPNGTFIEVSIFLEGFAMGAQVGGFRHRDSHSKFSPFFRWLAAGQDRKYLGGGWKEFRESYGDDAAALDGLAQSYRKYAESVSTD